VENEILGSFLPHFYLDYEVSPSGFRGRLPWWKMVLSAKYFAFNKTEGTKSLLVSALLKISPPSLQRVTGLTDISNVIVEISLLEIRFP